MDHDDEIGAAALAETARMRQTTENLRELLRAAAAAEQAAADVTPGAGPPPPES